MPFEIRFKDESLEKLQWANARTDRAFPTGIANTFRKRLGLIRGAADERDFHAMRSLGFERLQGKREHQHSMRLNDQWRLILEIEGDGPTKTISIVAIEDYH